MSCCNCPDTCSLHDVKRIDEILYSINDHLTVLTDKKLKNLFYGYFCEESVNENIMKLAEIRKSLTRRKLELVVGKTTCICPEDLQRIIEKAIKIIGKVSCPVARRDVHIDETQVEKYLLSKPACVSYDTWNKFARGLCGDLGFKIEVEKDICDLTFEISREIIPCNLLYTLSIYRQMCDLNYKVNRTHEECKIDYKLLAERHCELNLTMKDYLKVVKDCNLSFNTVDQCYRAGLQILIQQNRAYLKTQLNVYPIDSITPSNLDRLIGLGFGVTISDIITQEYI